MKTWIIATTLGIALSAAGASGAFAQAGSTGGTIGKQDKSVSGGEEKAEPKYQPSRVAPSHVNEAECAKLVGTWTWPGGMTTFNADHTMRHNSGNHGTWSCKGRDVTITWADGVGIDLATFTVTGELSVHSTKLGITFAANKT